MGADMQPGTEMDRMVAEAVGFTGEIRTNLMELCRKSFYRIGGGAMRAPYVWRPHRDLDDAIAALDATGHHYSIMTYDNGEMIVSIGPERDTVWLRGNLDDWPWALAKGIPEAACRAILAWREGRRE